MDGIHVCPNVEILDLSRNRLTRLADMGALTRLRVLHLEGNMIDDLRGLASHPCLMEIYLAGNLLASVESLRPLVAACPALARIDLADLSGRARNPVCDAAGYEDAVLAAFPRLDILDGQRLRYATVYKARPRDVLGDGAAPALSAEPWLPLGFFPELPPFTGALATDDVYAALAECERLDAALRAAIARPRT